MEEELPTCKGLLFKEAAQEPKPVSLKGAQTPRYHKVTAKPADLR